MLKQSNVLLVEVPQQFIALRETTGVSPQCVKVAAGLTGLSDPRPWPPGRSCRRPPWAGS
jgi:hypothetical protein